MMQQKRFQSSLGRAIVGTKRPMPEEASHQASADNAIPTTHVQHEEEPQGWTE